MEIFLILSCLVILHCQIITAYMMRSSTSTPPSYQTFNPCPYIEGKDFILPYIAEQPYNPAPTNYNLRPQTVITDCTPQVCKNLANTIQLMIVSNLLKNTSRKGSADAIRLAAPILREVLASIQTNSPGLIDSAIGKRIPTSSPKSLINCGSGMGLSQSKLLNALTSFSR